DLLRPSGLPRQSSDRLGEGRLTEPTADTRARRWELVKMPLSCLMAVRAIASRDLTTYNSYPAGPFNWAPTDPALNVPKRGDAAELRGPSLPPPHDLRYPCRLLPWRAEARVSAQFSLPRLVGRER